MLYFEPALIRSISLHTIISDPTFVLIPGIIVYWGSLLHRCWETGLMKSLGNRFYKMVTHSNGKQYKG